MRPGYRAWTEEEKATLRTAYAAGGARAACAALPDRSAAGVYDQARKLGIVLRRPWTEIEDRRLRNLLDDGRTLKFTARTLGRTICAVADHARAIGVSCSIPQGYESLNKAADRVGYNEQTLRRILEASKVLLHRRRWSKNLRKGGHHYVDPFDVDDAIAEWVKEEPLATAARRLGFLPITVRRRLGLRSGWKHVRVTEEQVLRAMAGVRTRKHHGPVVEERRAAA